MASRIAIDVMRMSLARLLHLHGVDRLPGTAQDVLIDVSARFLELLARTAHETAQLNERTQPSLADLVVACELAGLDVAELADYARDWRARSVSLAEKRAKASALGPSGAGPSATSTALPAAAAGAGPAAGGQSDAQAAGTAATTTTAAPPTATAATAATAAVVPDERTIPPLGFPRMEPGPFPLNPDLFVEDDETASSPSQTTAGHGDDDLIKRESASCTDMDVDAPERDLVKVESGADHAADADKLQYVDPTLPPLPTKKDLELLEQAIQEAEAPAAVEAPELLLDLEEDLADEGEFGRGRSGNPYAGPVSYHDSQLLASGRKVASFPASASKPGSRIKDLGDDMQVDTQLPAHLQNPEKTSFDLLVAAIQSINLHSAPNLVIPNDDMVRYMTRREIVGISFLGDSLFPHDRGFIDDVFVMTLSNMDAVFGCEKMPDEAVSLPPIDQMLDVRTRHDLSNKRVSNAAASGTGANAPPSMAGGMSGAALAMVPSIPTVKLKAPLPGTPAPSAQKAGAGQPADSATAASEAPSTPAASAGDATVSVKKPRTTNAKAPKSAKPPAEEASTVPSTPTPAAAAPQADAAKKADQTPLPSLTLKLAPLAPPPAQQTPTPQAKPLGDATPGTAPVSVKLEAGAADAAATPKPAAKSKPRPKPTPKPADGDAAAAGKDASKAAPSAAASDAEARPSKPAPSPRKKPAKPALPAEAPTAQPPAAAAASSSEALAPTPSKPAPVAPHIARVQATSATASTPPKLKFKLTVAPSTPAPASTPAAPAAPATPAPAALSVPATPAQAATPTPAPQPPKPTKPAVPAPAQQASRPATPSGPAEPMPSFKLTFSTKPRTATPTPKPSTPQPAPAPSQPSAHAAVSLPASAPAHHANRSPKPKQKPKPPAPEPAQTPSRLPTAAAMPPQQAPIYSTPAALPPAPAPAPAASTDEEVINCVCDLPAIDYGLFMVACDVCSHWFHGHCVGVMSDVDEWVCPRCRRR